MSNHLSQSKYFLNVRGADEDLFVIKIYAGAMALTLWHRVRRGRGANASPLGNTVIIVPGGLTSSSPQASRHTQVGIARFRTTKRSGGVSMCL